MTFPGSGLPDYVEVVRSDPQGRDARGNMQYVPRTLLKRSARLYRRVVGIRRDVTQGTLGDEMVAFDWHCTDDVVEGDAAVVNGHHYEISNVKLMKTWKRPSHWELTLVEVR
jgi:hypothetical protein